MDNVTYWTTEAFFKRLDHFLSEKKWSIHQLCIEADITAASIYTMKSRDSLPNFVTICTICDAIGITLFDFFYEEEVLDNDTKIIFSKTRILSPELRSALALIMSKIA